MGFAAANRFSGLGLWRLTHRARLLVARFTGDHYSIRVHGVAIGGSLSHHGPYLRWLSGGADLHPFQLELFEAALTPGMVVVDCGAHLGLYSVLAAQRVGSRGRVVALEPDEPNLRALHGNLDANDVADRVEVVDAAASDHAGTAAFYLYEDNSARTTSSLSPLPGLAPTEVRCVTLDEVLAGRRVDVAKIDVEGAETLVLGGMRETLERSPGATFFIECHPPPLGAANPIEWLPALREQGALELIDEQRRELIPATDDEITRLTKRLAGWVFNVRWTVGQLEPTSP